MQHDLVPRHDIYVYISVLVVIMVNVKWTVLVGNHLITMSYTTVINVSNNRIMHLEYCGKSSYYIIIILSRNYLVTFPKHFATLKCLIMLLSTKCKHINIRHKKYKRRCRMKNGKKAAIIKTGNMYKMCIM